MTQTGLTGAQPHIRPGATLAEDVPETSGAEERIDSNRLGRDEARVKNVMEQGGEDKEDRGNVKNGKIKQQDSRRRTMARMHKWDPNVNEGESKLLHDGEVLPPDGEDGSRVIGYLNHKEKNKDGTCPSQKQNDTVHLPTGQPLPHS